MCTMSSKLERELKDPFKKAGSDRMVVYSPEVLRSALFNAISEAEVEDVQLCVERGANLDWRDEGEASCGLTTLQLHDAAATPRCGHITLR